MTNTVLDVVKCTVVLHPLTKYLQMCNKTLLSNDNSRQKGLFKFFVVSNFNTSSKAAFSRLFFILKHSKITMITSAQTKNRRLGRGKARIWNKMSFKYNGVMNWNCHLTRVERQSMHV